MIRHECVSGANREISPIFLAAILVLLPAGIVWAALSGMGNISQTQILKACRVVGAQNIAMIAWVERSDWLNVQKDLKVAARGDGKADDTAALQAAIDRMSDRPGGSNTVYLPPGTYRITRTLHIKHNRSMRMIGHGRSTIIRWDGPKDGRMLWSDGAPRTSYIGIVWDGANKAGVGIDHDSKSYYETRVMHEHLVFKRFRLAGIRVGHDQKTASAEMYFRDILFTHNRNGALFQSWNDYNNLFNACHFVENDYGIRAEKGNVVVRDSRFERSRVSDLFLSTHSHSVRRVISRGSNAFIHTVRGPMANGLIRVEDALVDGWQDPKGAIVTSLRGPVFVFDTRFTNPPNKKPPIRLNQPIYMDQIAMTMNVVSPGSKRVIDGGPSGVLYRIPDQSGYRPAIELTQRFLWQQIPSPQQVLDVKRDCGAKGDGRWNDTLAVQHCLDLAGKAAVPGNTVVYFPLGVYRISKTLQTRAGAGYRIEGVGWLSRIIWSGLPGGTLLQVTDPNGLQVQSLALGGPRGTRTLHQTGTRPSVVRYHHVYGFYDDETKQVWIEFDHLPKGSLVLSDHIDGRIAIRDSSEAEILLGSVMSVQNIIEGRSPTTGFTGILSRASALEDYPLIIRDNQNLVMTDWYNEQTTHLFQFEGGQIPGRMGHVVLDSIHQAFSSQDMGKVTGYQGLIALMGAQTGAGGKDLRHKFRLSSPRLDLFMANNTFWYQAPTFPDKSAGIKISLLGNSISKKRLAAFSRVDDSSPAVSYKAMGQAILQLRRLGERDLAFNYCVGVR